MAKQLIVGMYNPDGPKQCASDDWSMRLQELRIAMTTTFSLDLPPIYPVPPPPKPSAAKQAIPAVPVASSSPLRIFLAPEYFFRKNWGRSEAARVTSAYSEDEALAISGELLRFSRAYPNLLLIGGSIFWRPKERRSIFKKRTIRHSLVVAHNGQRLLDYEKRNACNELQPFEARSHRFQPGVRHGLFQCDGLSCGLETCVDHSSNQLGQDGASGLDLQIVVSNSVSITQGHAHARPGGFVLHCDAAQNPAQASWTNQVYSSPFAWDSKVGPEFTSVATTNSGACSCST